MVVENHAWFTLSLIYADFFVCLRMILGSDRCGGILLGYPEVSSKLNIFGTCECIFASMFMHEHERVHELSLCFITFCMSPNIRPYLNLYTAPLCNWRLGTVEV